MQNYNHVILVANDGFNRSWNSQYMQTSTSGVIGRYFGLKFTYNLRRNTGGGQNNNQRDSRYKVGLRIRIIHLECEDTRYDGKEGVIEYIDGIGQLHGTWGSLAIIPEADDFEIIK